GPADAAVQAPLEAVERGAVDDSAVERVDGDRGAVAAAVRREAPPLAARVGALPEAAVARQIEDGGIGGVEGQGERAAARRPEEGPAVDARLTLPRAGEREDEGGRGAGPAGRSGPGHGREAERLGHSKGTWNGPCTVSIASGGTEVN